jgi:hypothetical protein
MTSQTERLLDETLMLSQEGRRELIDWLWETADRFVDPKEEEAWTNEIERRTGEVRTGGVKTIPWCGTMRQITEGADEPGVS